MTRSRWCLAPLTAAIVLGLASCGAISVGGGAETTQTAAKTNSPELINDADGATIWDVFGSSTTEKTVNVNRYIWSASLDVLNFLPVQSVDPFTGVIVTGYGTPPGGGRSYRATVHVNDPALDARSLNLSLQTSSGPVSAATTRAVEDAILTRARELRIRDRKY
ncbi:DUF3576 domain-containing protein [Albibacillus kandeliae]|uniref:DUF3576 domain-containing protein n=1 Tax=Albibacillus kandeliae TaxID=2174228 RepID=UPI000D6964B5|nr:DUF3576 domain-containing protein [Albibacillus kandeliae]